MATISKENKLLTVINVFTVEPAKQAQLIELLTALGKQSSTQKVPGLISSNLHRSLDGTKVTMYVQWQSKEDFDRMRSTQGVSPLFQQAQAIAKFEPGMYEVVETFGE